MKNKSYNYKYIIGLIMGLLIVISVSANNNIFSRDVYYDSNNSSITSGDVQRAIDDIRGKVEEIRPGYCKDGYECFNIKTTLSIGDYVYYEPVIEFYNTDIEKTNYEIVQTIYPKELKLWRVLFINADGTVDIISEDVSSTDVYFSGKLGYQNLVGYLNLLAKQYETEGITVDSRHFGYNLQTEYIEDDSMFKNAAPWDCSTGADCSPEPVESQGGGDILYENDYNKVQSVLKTAAAYKVGTTSLKAYWMASRNYNYSSSDSYNWYGRGVNVTGVRSNVSLYRYNISQFTESSTNLSIRPIVTLSADLSYEGVGIKDKPMRIIYD